MEGEPTDLERDDLYRFPIRPKEDYYSLVQMVLSKHEYEAHDSRSLLYPIKSDSFYTDTKTNLLDIVKKGKEKDLNLFKLRISLSN